MVYLFALAVGVLLGVLANAPLAVAVIVKERAWRGRR